MEKYIFTIEWTKGSINDNIVKFLKANNIDFYYLHGQPVADILGIGIYYKFDVEHISGDTYGIMIAGGIYI